MKKLFIIALSLFALVAFTTPASAGMYGSADAFGHNWQDASIFGGALAVPGFSIAGAYEDAWAEGITTGYSGWYSDASASQNTHYEYGVIFPATSSTGWSVVGMEGSVDQYSNGYTSYYYPGTFMSMAGADQEAYAFTHGGINWGYSTLGNEVDASAYTMATGGGSCYPWAWCGSRANAGASSFQHTSFATYNGTPDGLTFTYHAGSAVAGTRVNARDYGNSYRARTSSAFATASNVGGIRTNFNSFSFNGPGYSLGAMNMTGSIGAASTAAVQVNGIGFGSAFAGTNFEYAQQQVTGNGYQFQTGSVTTNVNVFGGGI